MNEPKHIETTEHPDGRKDVTITVHTLDVDLNDPSNAEAKRVIEEEVLPQLANKTIVVTLIHKPTNQHATFVSKLAQVRANAEVFVKKHAGKETLEEVNLSHYCIVQHDIEAQEVKVTSL